MYPYSQYGYGMVHWIRIRTDPDPQHWPPGSKSQKHEKRCIRQDKDRGRTAAAAVPNVDLGTDRETFDRILGAGEQVPVQVAQQAATNTNLENWQFFLS